MYKQKKLGARILSFALSAAMVFTMFPAIVFAAEGDVPLGASDTLTTTTETTQETIPVTYTAELPEGYALADSAKLPNIDAVVGKQAPAPRSARAGLSEGQLYYFDLSSEARDIGIISSYLQDQTLHYVPFIYVGSVEAYSLDASSSGVTNASDKADKNLSYRTLFMSPRNVSVNVSWEKLNGRNLIFGKNFDGNNYTLRSLSGGNRTAYPGASPKNNEWDEIRRINERYLENYHTPSWVQDTSSRNNEYRALRGKDSVGNWIDKKADRSGENNQKYGFRPVIQAKNPGNLKAVTLYLNGGYLSKYTDITSMNIVCGGNTFTAPSRTNLTRPNNGNYFEWNTRSDGSGTSYVAGASVPSSVTYLYALWVKPTPTIKVATQTGTATYGTVATPTYAVTTTNFSGEYPAFAPQVEWVGTAPTGVTPAFSSDKSTLTMTTTTATPAGDYKFKVVSPKTGSGNYESTEATLKVDKLTANITWGETSFTYDGNPQSPTATVGNKIGSDEVTVTVTGGQTNAGSHTATASTLNGTAAINYALPTNNTKVFNIAQKPVTTTLASGSVTKVYDGTTAKGTGTITFTTGDILPADTGTVTVAAGTIPPYSAVAVGTSYSLDVPVTLKGDTNNNYTLANSTVVVTGEITARPVTLIDGTLKIIKEYDGTTKAGIATGTLSSSHFVSGDDISGSVTDVGAYPDATVGKDKTVSLKVELTGSAVKNYSLANDKYSFTKAEITKAKPNVKVTADKKVKGPSSGNIGNKDDTFVITATVTGVTGENPIGNIQFKAGSTNLGGITTLTNGVATCEWVTPDAGTHTITADFTPSTNTNYATTSGSAEFTVDKAEQAALAFTAVPTTATYGEPAISFNATGGTGTGAVTYASSATNVVDNDGTIKGAGTATITATKAADNNYKVATATAIITVNPATPTIAWDSAEATQSLDYTGSAAVITAPKVTLKNSETYGGTINYSYKAKGSTNDYTNGLPTNAGEYEVKAKIAAKGNYTEAETATALTLTITKSSPTLTIITMNGKTYDGTAIANPTLSDMTITGANYTDVKFAYSKDSAMSNPSATAPTDAGNYWVKASIAEGTNTGAVDSTAVSFTIAKKAVTATVTGNDKAYDGNDTANIALSVDTGIGADKITITVQGATYADKNVGNSKAITIGSTTITGDKKDNYTITIPTITGEITAKAVTITAVVTEKDYDGNTTATATYTVNDVIGTETVTATGTANFDNANAGTNKTVNITSIALDGADKVNYKLSSADATTLGTINKASATVAIEAITAVDFTGSQIKPNITVKTGGTTLATTDYTVTYGTNVDAGTGAVTVKEATGGNYTFTDVTENFTINKIAYTGTAIVGTKLVKENTAQTGAEFDLSTLSFPAGFKDKTFGAVSYRANADGVLTGTPSITGTKLTFDVGAVVKGKSGVIDVVVSSKNYNDYTAKITVATVEKIPLSITGTAATGLVYNGSTQKGYTAVSVEDNKVPVSELDFTYSGKDKSGTAYGPTTTAPTKAGDYKLVVSVKISNQTYVGTSSDISFTIGQKELTVKADNRTMTKGGAMPTFTVNSSGFIAPDMATTAFATQPLASCTADGTSIGTFDITISTKAALNAGVGANYYIKSQDKGTLTVNVPHTGGSSSGNGSITPPPTVVTPDTTNPAPPTTVETQTPAIVDKNGNASVTVSDKTIQDAIDKAVSEAKKNGTSDNGVAVVINVTTGGKDAHTVTVNLPKTLQEKVIVGKVSNTILAVDRPDITINLNLASVIEINKQAKSDVQIIATRMDSRKLSGEAKTAIAGRPTYDLNATYAKGSKSVNSFGNGSVMVEIPYTLQKGEVAEGLYAVYVENNGEVSYIPNSKYDADAEVLRFATNHFSVYGVGYKAPTGFTDITNHWAKADIEFVVNRGLFSGISNTIFSPNSAMTRGMFVTVLGRMAKADISSYKTGTFSDVKADVYYRGYIEWASKNGIVKGIGEGKFAPDQAITREQMAVIIENYAKAIGYTLPNVHAEKTFADSAKIGAWAKDSVKKVQMAGVISGRSGNVFDPQGTATRAEVSAVLHRYIELVIDRSTATASKK